MSRTRRFLSVIAVILWCCLVLPAYAVFCPECGTKNDDKFKFCTQCGKPLPTARGVTGTDTPGVTTQIPAPPQPVLPNAIKLPEPPPPPPQKPPDPSKKERKSKEPLAHFLWAEEAFQQGDFETAKDEYKKTLELKKDYPEAQYKIAFILYRTLYLDEAAEAFRESLKIDKNNADAYYYLSAIERLKGRPPDELQNLKKTLELKRDHYLALNNMGCAVMKAKSFEDAITHFRNALRAKPDSWIAHNNLAAALMAKERWNEAQTELKAAWELNPDFANLYYNMGVTYERKNLNEDAIQQYHNALKIDPKMLEARVNLGLVNVKKDRLADAVEALQKAFDDNPTCAEAALNLSVAYKRQGKEDDAISYRKKACDLMHEYTLEQYDRGLAYGGKTEYDDERYKPEKNPSPKFKDLALTPLDRADEIDLGRVLEKIQSRPGPGPDTPEGRIAAGDKAFEANKPDQAIAEYARALQLKKEAPETMIKIALALGRKNMYAQSALFLEKATAMKPDSVDGFRALAKSYAVLKRMDDEIKAHRKVTELRPNEAEGFYELGMVLVRAKKTEDAQKTLRKFLELDPQSIKKDVVEKILSNLTK